MLMISFLLPLFSLLILDVFHHHSGMIIAPSSQHSTSVFFSYKSSFSSLGMIKKFDLVVGVIPCLPNGVTHKNHNKNFSRNLREIAICYSKRSALKFIQMIVIGFIHTNYVLHSGQIQSFVYSRSLEMEIDGKMPVEFSGKPHIFKGQQLHHPNRIIVVNGKRNCTSIHIAMKRIYKENCLGWFPSTAPSRRLGTLSTKKVL